MANYQIKLVLRPKLVLRSSCGTKSRVTQCSINEQFRHGIAGRTTEQPSSVVRTFNCGLPVWPIIPLVVLQIKRLHFSKV